MTLNSHFALNTVFRVESFSVDALVLRHDCFKIHGDEYILSAAKIAHGLWCGFWRYKSMPIFVGVRWWGGVKWKCGRRKCEFSLSIAISSVLSSLLTLDIEIYTASRDFSATARLSLNDHRVGLELSVTVSEVCISRILDVSICQAYKGPTDISLTAFSGDFYGPTARYTLPRSSAWQQQCVRAKFQDLSLMRLRLSRDTYEFWSWFDWLIFEQCRWRTSAPFRDDFVAVDKHSRSLTLAAPMLGSPIANANCNSLAYCIAHRRAWAYSSRICSSIYVYSMLVIQSTSSQRLEYRPIGGRRSM